MGQALASFVLRHRPADGGCVTLEFGDMDDFPDWCSVIRIATFDGGWHTSSSADLMTAERDYVADCIAAKTKRVPRYRTRAPGYQIWLLIATQPSVLWSIEVPDSLADWRFNFDFDKVILLSWEGSVIELKRE